MEPDSIINTTAKGHYVGPGYSNGDGASYAGQGGSQLKDSSNDATYGSFSQTPNTERDHQAQLGSGGGEQNRRGGGVIIIIVDSGTVQGSLFADGSPSITQGVKKEFHAGSGGYVYVKANSASIVFESDSKIHAHGGYGSDDKTSNAGSGGRIVLENVIIGDSNYAANGGCSNILTTSNYNGAAGTIYFASSKKLIIKHTDKCLASKRTILDSAEIETKEVEEIRVDNKATISFSKLRVVKNVLNVVIK
eukprot:CAMPEP_0205817192 /NCGR_PEP_ID=MMETSP0205-20121125/23923_1 /ASSEMBLY_ACC=CAM_ASM_000278 /TAXON_ID=36767 /ORGANISM="Euplotes focardii, Strain TN1" /LENGTH=248 /DNA_ID=CAMNT_0053107179 /DNA_START=139 /DNA_END=882 /DNA_ORIENTATION=+